MRPMPGPMIAQVLLLPSCLVSSRTPWRPWDIRQPSCFCLKHLSLTRLYGGPKKPVYSRTNDPKGFTMALASKNGRRTLHLVFVFFETYTLKAHLLHLEAWLTRGLLCCMSSTCDLFAFVYTEDLKRAGKVKVMTLVYLLLWIALGLNRVAVLLEPFHSINA